jgi:large subunit ribosomal protein L5
MKTIRIEKLTLNVGAGKDQGKLDKGVKLLKNLTGITPVKTVSKKRIPSWGLRPGLPIGCKLTLRGKKAEEMLKKLLSAKENILRPSQVDTAGNLAFGIHEYIDIPGLEYDPEIKIMGLEVCVTLERPGYRIKKRRTQKTKIGEHHLIHKEEAINYFKEAFAVKINED